MATDINENVKAREEFRAVVDLLSGEQHSKHFWHLLSEECKKHLPPPTPPPNIDPPMTEYEAVFFEETPMPFGKHLGTLIGQVPITYLIWLVEDEFNKKLRKYMKTQKAQQRVRDEQ